jgi:spore coat protein CotH
MPGTQPPPLHPRSPRWQRLLVLAVLTSGGAFVLTVLLGLLLAGLFQNPWFQEWAFTNVFSRSWAGADKPPAPPRVPYTPSAPEPDARLASQPADIFIPTQVWSTHLRFTEAEWTAIQPQRIPRSRGWLRRDGAPMLSNTNAPRPGLAGVFGIAQPWSTAHVDFGSVQFSNVAVRFKGNGTFLFAEGPYSRPYKLDLSKKHPGRNLAGLEEINLHNLSADRSCLSDTLGYEFFRDAGVPAPRTTFTRLLLSIDGRWERSVIGLYLVVEDPSESWLARFLGAPGGSLFKPVTLELFQDLGTDWSAYPPVYNPKSDIPDTHRQRLVDLARLVSHADDAEFERRIFDLVDLGHFTRFLACETLLSNYDGIFANGQNFLLWIDPRNDRFGLSPWDLDHSWGGFHLIGTHEQRVRADVFHPWVGEHRFFERLYALPAFQERYRAELTRLLDTVFVPERLHQRIDELAAVIRPVVQGHRDPRPDQFERAIAASSTPAASQPHGERGGPVHALKPFITRRAAEVRAQLAGTSQGLRVSRQAERQR